MSVAKPAGSGKVGQLRLAELDGDVGALRDPERVVAGLGQLVEQVPHLVRGLQVVLVAVELEAVGIAHLRSGLHAQERVVRGRVAALDVVAVVGGEQRRLQLLGDLQQQRVGAVLVGDPVVLQLDEERVPPEDVLQPPRRLQGPVLSRRLSRCCSTCPPRQPDVAIRPLLCSVEQIEVAVVDREVRYVRVIFLDLEVVDEPVVLLRVHSSDRSVHVVVVGEHASAPALQPRQREVRSVLQGVAIVSVVPLSDRRERIQMRGGELAHLPRELLRGLREDHTRPMLRAVAGENPVEQAVLELEVRLERELRKVLVVRALAAKATQECCEGG